jgi:hypothetical protein
MDPSLSKLSVDFAFLPGFLLWEFYRFFAGGLRFTFDSCSYESALGGSSYGGFS